MAAKGKRREKTLKARAEARAQKHARMKRGGVSSAYAAKKREQANGTFRPASPFEAITPG